jgi:hypothetical protein
VLEDSGRLCNGETAYSRSSKEENAMGLWKNCDESLEFFDNAMGVLEMGWNLEMLWSCVFSQDVHLLRIMLSNLQQQAAEQRRPYATAVQ